jgi:hypothetical protein
MLIVHEKQQFSPNAELTQQETPKRGNAESIYKAHVVSTRQPLSGQAIKQSGGIAKKTGVAPKRTTLQTVITTHWRGEIVVVHDSQLVRRRAGCSPSEKPFAKIRGGCSVPDEMAMEEAFEGVQERPKVLTAGAGRMRQSDVRRLIAHGESVYWV